MDENAVEDYNSNSFTSPAQEEMTQLVIKELETRQKLVELEQEIFTTEGEYLAETASDGNLVRGWEVRRVVKGCEGKIISHGLSSGSADQPGAGPLAGPEVQEVQAGGEDLLQVERHLD